MKKKTPDEYQIWIEVRKRYHLSDVHIQMARELGMNPKKFGKIANEKQEPWKAPLPAFIERIYFKRFGRERPLDVKFIEQVLLSFGTGAGRQDANATSFLQELGETGITSTLR